ncbi:MAG TPA: glycoside hydrolase family 2 protein [Cellulomonas sp.]|uniref:glycosyl hydrolase 2 galactose-binding domain-containing protein n=1 Tax=Cellulomonas sp. TaxID=40001 RepID=UPI002E32EB0D|nr:glycoside hydrolase family 2 protein [Cellulomonas sp.]HEX5333565.1 glycoside hydrolase family 2 protein [Cellulomonas sp.]
MITQELHDGWTLRAAGGPVPAEIALAIVPAEVPGSVHTDLLAAGLIPDPYLDSNETSLAWMHRADWRYELPLAATAPADDERVDLVFDGLDTVATIELDGSRVGQTANQHRSYRFDIGGLLGTGEHTLAVHFRSALEYAEAERERLGRRPSAYEHPLNMVRKMACSFGWDWGPDLQTAGMWKPVRLERWRTARLAQVRPLVTVEADGTGRVAVHVDIERAGLMDADDLALVVRASLRGGDVAAGAVTAQAVMAPGATTAVILLELAHAPLWWPVGHGEQPLVDLDVTLDEVDAGAGGAPLDEWHRRIGFRTVEIDTQPDEIGAPFTFRINGRPIFAKGANWIPDDHLLTRITRERLVRRIDQALGANLNLLRVWGGGIYETDDFYDVCDERGILVWQDFPLACSAYPEEEPLWGELDAEARQNVARLTPHPALVLWNGGNENLWGFMDWGWQEELAGATWGYRYYTELFPAVVAELDPTRPYAEGSPCSPGEQLDVVHPNDPDHGTHHQWEVWNRVDYTAYRDEVPRFCSEFGFQAPPTWSTLERAVRNPDGAPLGKEDPVFLLHQKADDGNGKLDRGLAPHLGVPTDFADWHWATQLNQARAVAYAIEHYRSWWPRTAGAIVWQLNDCWPVTSWAAVDSDERPKPLWYALRHANADRTITVQRRDDRDALSIVNDTAETWRGTVHLSRQLLDGTPLAAAELPAKVAPWSAATITLPDDVRLPGDPTGEVLVAELDGTRTVHTWVEDVALRLDPAPLEASVTPFDDGYRVEVRATSLARDVTLLVDRLDPAARVDDALITLPAGTSTTFTVHTSARLTAAELTGPLVLRSANDLVRSRAVGRSGRSGAIRGSDGPEPTASSAPAPVPAAAEASGPVVS